ncbi:hypothetical protein Q5P01_017869 [Channa striata]|uniref:Uncharacterized protein n=1 Tax=Channa striata TaxID=64152 RepID=A0AA88M5I4_CHASR|nr:hypothetical protein Q5P01_017869 [Channa striata]
MFRPGESVTPVGVLQKLFEMMLETKLRALKISVAVSAMTNKAAGALMESGSLARVHTFHKLMGFKSADRGRVWTDDGEPTREDAASPRVWENERLEELMSCSTLLLVNRRQFEDPGYAEALAHLQFNDVTKAVGGSRVGETFLSVTKNRTGFLCAALGRTPVLH